MSDVRKKDTGISLLKFALTAIFALAAFGFVKHYTSPGTIASAGDGLKNSASKINNVM